MAHLRSATNPLPVHLHTSASHSSSDQDGKQRTPPMRSILFAAIAISWGIVGCSEVPGGLPSSYQAKDFDLFLTKKAATATPIVATVHRYRGTHDSYPPDLKSFQGSLPSAVVVRQDTADDWRYSRSEGGSGFQLVIKLG